MTSVAIYDWGEGRKVGSVLMIVGKDRDNHSFRFPFQKQFFFLEQCTNVPTIQFILYACYSV